MSKVISSTGRILNTDVPFSSWKAFENLMNRLDKAKEQTKQAIQKEKELEIMVKKRAKYLNIIG